MDFYLDDLTIKTTGIKAGDILSSWTWLVTDFAELIFISKLGDLFFSGNDGCIYWLATDNCILTKIADNRIEFDLLLNDDSNVSEWFLPQLLNEIVQVGLLLGSNQVYSYKKMPVLGGDYEVDNIELTDVKLHFHLTGVIGEQIKDLPAGTKLTIKVTE